MSFSSLPQSPLPRSGHARQTPADAELALYRRACDVAGLGFYEQDAHWRFTYVSDYLRQKWQDAFGLGSTDLIGRDPREIFLHSAAGPSRAELIERYRASPDHSTSVEYQLTDAQGQAIWFEVREQAVFDAEGGLIGCRGVMIDITRSKIAEAASQMKSHFLTNVSHELRTPLNAIIGYAEMAAEDLSDAPAQAHIHGDLLKIANAAQHLLGLIENLLDFSALEADRLEVDLSTLDLGELINELAPAARSLAELHHNALVIVLQQEQAIVRTDRGKVRRCLLNLLSNAAKFTQDGEIAIELTRTESNEIAIAVRDTGPGVALHDRARIFRPFIQAEAGVTRRAGGMGIGLALTQSLAARIGGRIELKTRPGEGSTFTLYLPSGAAPLDEARKDAA